MCGSVLENGKVRKTISRRAREQKAIRNRKKLRRESGGGERRGGGTVREKSLKELARNCCNRKERTVGRQIAQ